MYRQTAASASSPSSTEALPDDAPASPPPLLRTTSNYGVIEIAEAFDIAIAREPNRRLKTIMAEVADSHVCVTNKIHYAFELFQKNNVSLYYLPIFLDHLRPSITPYEKLYHGDAAKAEIHAEFRQFDRCAKVVADVLKQAKQSAWDEDIYQLRSKTTELMITIANNPEKYTAAKISDACRDIGWPNDSVAHLLETLLAEAGIKIGNTQAEHKRSAKLRMG